MYRFTRSGFFPKLLSPPTSSCKVRLHPRWVTLRTSAIFLNRLALDFAMRCLFPRAVDAERPDEAAKNRPNENLKAVAADVTIPDAAKSSPSEQSPCPRERLLADAPTDIAKTSSTNPIGRTPLLAMKGLPTPFADRLHQASWSVEGVVFERAESDRSRLRGPSRRIQTIPIKPCLNGYGTISWMRLEVFRLNESKSNEKLLGSIPELKTQFKNYISGHDGMETGAFLTYEGVFRPHVEYALTTGDLVFLERVANFIEGLYLTGNATL